jgi:acetyltransferase-like isoleucine patch superfamily enzyme
MSYLTRIRNRDGRIADLLYRTYRRIERFNIRPGLLHRFLRQERALRGMLWSMLKSKLYEEPIFRLACTECGQSLHLVGGIPSVYGEMELHVGEKVTLHGSTSFFAAKVFARPRLAIGDRTHCGSFFNVSVGAGVHIGNDVLIANRVTLVAYDGHPMDAELRRRGLPAEAASSRPIYIEDDVWICQGAMIMKGVRVGRGSIIAADAVVVKDVPAYSVVAGNPARIVKTLAGQARGASSVQERG